MNARLGSQVTETLSLMARIDRCESLVATSTVPAKGGDAAPRLRGSFRRCQAEASIGSIVISLPDGTGLNGATSVRRSGGLRPIQMWDKLTKLSPARFALKSKTPGAAVRRREITTNQLRPSIKMPSCLPANGPITTTCASSRATRTFGSRIHHAPAVLRQYASPSGSGRPQQEVNVSRLTSNRNQHCFHQLSARPFQSA